MKKEKDGVELDISEEAKTKNIGSRKKASGGVHKKSVSDKKMTTAEIRALREAKLKKIEEEYNYQFESEHGEYDEKPDKTFYIYGLMLAVVVCILSFYLIFTFTSNKTDTGSDISNNLPSNVVTDVNDDGKHDLDDQLASEYKTVVGYISDIDNEYKTIEIVNIENGEPLTIVVNSSTALTDEFGRALIFSEFELGDGLEIYYTTANNMAISVTKSDDFFTKTGKTGIDTNSSIGSVVYNDDTYYTNDYTIILDKDGNTITLDDIDETDYITFKGTSNFIDYIKVDKGHGTINFTNVEYVTNPEADININSIIDLSETTSCVVGEGEYKVVVTGDNITPYIQYITINAGGTEDIDLALTTGKLGNVYVTCNADDIVLKINDKEYDETKPITLPYGEYVATVTKLNYSGESQSFTINKPTTNLVFNLVPLETDVTLDITTTPEGAEVYVDNQLVGVTPLKQSISAGTHSILVKYVGKYDRSFTIDGSEDYYRYDFTMLDKPDEETEEPEENTESEDSDSTDSTNSYTDDEDVVVDSGDTGN